MSPVKPPADAPRGGSRRRDRAETRARMLDAARRLFLERGYAATTILEIAAAAGVAVPTIYWAFGSKRAMVSEIRQAWFEAPRLGGLEPGLPDLADHCPLGAERPVDRGHGDAGRGGDLEDRRRRIATFEEEPPGRVEHPGPRLGPVAATGSAPRCVGRGLDRTHGTRVSLQLQL